MIFKIGLCKRLAQPAIGKDDIRPNVLSDRFEEHPSAYEAFIVRVCRLCVTAYRREILGTVLEQDPVNVNTIAFAGNYKVGNTLRNILQRCSEREPLVTLVATEGAVLTQHGHIETCNDLTLGTLLPDGEDGVSLGTCTNHEVRVCECRTVNVIVSQPATFLWQRSIPTHESIEGITVSYGTTIARCSVAINIDT